MIVKTPESQMGSPAAAEGREEAMGGGRGGSGERSEVQARSSLTSTAPKARSRSREITDIGKVVVDVSHHSARPDIGMPVYDGGIRVYSGFLVDTVKARGGTTSRGSQRDTKRRCDTMLDFA